MYKSLIIDDEKPVRIAITALGRWQHYCIEKPFTALNGKDGLNTMRELNPDIVFVDMQMPVMNGIQFLQHASKEFSKTKYIVVSGYDDFQYARSAIKYGAIDYLLKPIVAGELDKALEKATMLLNAERHTPPTQASKNPTISPDETIDIIKDYIEKHYSEDIKVSMFSEKYFFSQKYLSKLFKKKYHVGIYEYALNLRMHRAKILLQDSALLIQDISDRLGYSNNNYFSKAFKNHYNMSPSEFREQK